MDKVAYDGENIENNEIQFYFNSMFIKLLDQLKVHPSIINNEKLGWGGVLFQQFTVQFYTAMQLTYERTISPLKKGKYLDIVSINTINRSAFENFLMFEYIYNLPESKEEQDLRFWTYQYYGYKECRNLSDSRSQEEQYFSEKMDLLKKKIKNNKQFLKMDPTKQAEFLVSGNSWRPSWNEIARQVRLSPINSQKEYKMLSWFAHASFASIRATNQYYDSLDGYDVDATNSHLYIVSALYIQSVIFVYGLSHCQFTEDEKGIWGEFLHLSGKKKEELLKDCERISKKLWPEP